MFLWDQFERAVICGVVNFSEAVEVGAQWCGSLGASAGGEGKDGWFKALERDVDGADGLLACCVDVVVHVHGGASEVEGMEHERNGAAGFELGFPLVAHR